ncbi:response regulator transcription factor [Sphingomonas qomolangmaensis]|uniref:Response regulator n=1 Tax=Sphingomonas qomolangmaensis TaxID=2918765 RepID=A0ABY5LDM3_9SPHN|nr:response regulator [Sphingomonas qomolangmaensis]UUL83819.1 response regulator [Sphingomonas qomolangmaensis]
MSLILIADDDELLAALVRYKLEAAGHRVIVAENGAAALAAVEQDRPDLVVLDAMMPMLTGFEVLARLKHDRATAGLPVIMLTARRSEDDVAAALRGGAADYLTKPFVPEELLMRVETALAQARMPGQPGTGQ